MKVLKGFENVSEGNLEEWLQQDVCLPAIHYMTDACIISTASE
jgi:hypothetical protein